MGEFVAAAGVTTTLHIEKALGKDGIYCTYKYTDDIVGKTSIQTWINICGSHLRTAIESPSRVLFEIGLRRHRIL